MNGVLDARAPCDPHPFSRGGGPLYVTYIFSIFQVSKMQYYIFDIGPKNVSSLTVLQSYIYRCYERICNITVLGPRT